MRLIIGVILIICISIIKSRITLVENAYMTYLENFLADHWWAGIAAIGTLLGAIGTPVTIASVQYILTKKQGVADGELRKEIQTSSFKLQEKIHDIDRKDRNFALLLKILDDMMQTLNERELDLKLNFGLGVCGNESEDHVLRDLRILLYIRYGKNPTISLKKINEIFPRELSIVNQKDIFTEIYKSLPDKIIDSADFIEDIVNFLAENRTLIDSKLFSLTPVLKLLDNSDRIHEIGRIYGNVRYSQLHIAQTSLFNFFKDITAKLSDQDEDQDKDKAQATTDKDKNNEQSSAIKDFWTAIRQQCFNNILHLLHEFSPYSMLIQNTKYSLALYLGSANTIYHYLHHYQLAGVSDISDPGDPNFFYEAIENFTFSLVHYHDKIMRRLNLQNDFDDEDLDSDLINENDLDSENDIDTEDIDNKNSGSHNIDGLSHQVNVLDRTIAQGFLYFGIIYSCTKKHKVVDISQTDIERNVERMKKLASYIQDSENSHKFTAIINDKDFHNGVQMLNDAITNTW